MKKLLTILLLFFTAHSFAQDWVAPKGATVRCLPREKAGTSYMRVMYSHKYMPDTLARDNFDGYVAVLHIGRNGVSAYEEYSSFKSDSLTVGKMFDNQILVEDVIDQNIDYISEDKLPILSEEQLTKEA